MATLRVVPSDVESNEQVVGPKVWENRIRRRAKELAADLEHGYMELAEILYRVCDEPAGGDPKAPPLYMAWGYKTFSEYVEKELNFEIRKAQRLRNIWYRLEVELVGLDPGLKRRLVSLGWTKVRELVRVLTLQNAEDWVELAEKHSYRVVEDAVRTALDKAARERVEVAIKGIDYTVISPVEGAELVSKNAKKNSEGTEVAEPGKPLSPASSSADAQKKPSPRLQLQDEDKEVRRETLYLRLYPETYKTVMDALDRASELSGKQGINYRPLNLELICTDFLATNVFMTGGIDEKLRYVAKLERLTGLRFIVTDQECTQVLYGIDTLEALAKGSGEG